MPLYDVVCSNDRCDLNGVPRQQLVPSWRIQLRCENCEAPVEKQPAAPAFHLHGSGWAKDGYAK